MNNLKKIEWEETSSSINGHSCLKATPVDNVLLQVEKKSVGRFDYKVIVGNKQKEGRGLPSAEKAKDMAVRMYDAYRFLKEFPDKIII